MNTERTSAETGRAPVIAIALLSASALGYEVLLIRLFSIIQWHHFAYMIISLALLGYGASGTFLTLVQTAFLRRYPVALLANIALFAAATVPCFLLAQHIRFNPEQMLWDWHESLRLMLIYLLLSVPFFFAANAIGLTLARYRGLINRIYAADLLGAGAGSLLILLLLYLLPPLPGLAALCVIGCACLPVAARELQLRARGRIVLVALLLAAAATWSGLSARLELSPYKSLSQTLQVQGARIVAERHSPLGLLAVVENTAIPPRYAPGMSLAAEQGPPAQLSLFSDGNSMGVITRDDGTATMPAFLDQLTSALPYHLGSVDPVLVAGAGGGMDVLQAAYEGAGEIHAVEINPQVTGLMLDDYAEFSGHLYERPGVHLHTGDVRGFVASHARRYGLIQFSLQDSPGVSGTGVYALSENYLYTTEALVDYLQHLRPGGYLAVTQWIKLPPRNTLKLFATAIDALRATGNAPAGVRLMLIRGWQTSTLVVKNGAFTPGEIDAMRRFCRERAFDTVWYPGIDSAEVNHYNRLREPAFHDAALALLGAGREAFLDSYKFDLRPASDDRPYFYNFFKWSALAEILSLRERGGLPLLEAGYPVIVATLAQATLLSLLLILFPLLWRRRSQREQATMAERLRVVGYFTAIGLAFLFLEIAFIQKFMRFLHHPVYTAAVILASFLVFAGLGSFRSQRDSDRGRQRLGARRAVACIVLISLLYLFALDPLFDRFAAWPPAARMALSSLLIAPLAFCMGAPFPLALARLAGRSPCLIPLAWGVNGCASVLSAVLATLLAVHFGFAAVVVLALVLYASAAALFAGGWSDTTAHS
ncbi:MAG: SAM-dependent methyltransferase [Gammaproteobacteria bacterium]